MRGRDHPPRPDPGGRREENAPLSGPEALAGGGRRADRRPPVHATVFQAPTRARSSTISHLTSRFF